MSFTINAHQLGRLLNQTAEHMGGEYNEQLYGIRLEGDARYLYAIASDAYTLAVARHPLNDGDQDQEPFARTIPAAYLRSLREWIDSFGGAQWVTVSVAEDRLFFEGPLTNLSIAVDTALEFPDWRGILRKALDQTADSEPIPALNSGFLARFGATGHVLRVRFTADQKPAVLIGPDFIGAQMPTRSTVHAPAADQSFAAASDSWLWTLAAGSKDADMAVMPADERSRYAVTTDVQETAEGLLRGVLRSTKNSFDVGYFGEDREALYAYIHAGVSDWVAYRYLDALYRVDPRAAQAVVTDTADELDSGELGEFAWEAAEEAGHSPKKWQDDYEAAVQKRAAEEPPLWAQRLAAGLNAAHNAGIAVDIDDTPHVRFDEGTGTWVAVKPEPADATP
ncbi:hypothetical protein [Streptomyces sp. NPDC091215]|uniref:hypothetical protein n=1 Tax=Streptomyces sp. NPDC091215 TaxID=3155192 RepID=UPI003436A3C1